MEVYFDNAATTKVYKEVSELMSKIMEEDYGNPSSLHTKGVAAGRYIKESREILARELKVDTKEITFTSGGTESNNMAVIGATLANRRGGNKVIISSIEHPSVSAPAKFLEEAGFDIVYLKVDSQGIVDMEQLKQELDKDTILVSVMYVNNEIGSIQPVEEIGRLVHEVNPDAVFHVDAIQAFGKLRIYPKRMGIDMLSISGHKIHGPKGSGALFIKDRIKVKPVIYGGGQQNGMRSGTENVPAIAGLGLAVKLTCENLEEKAAHMKEVKEHLIEGLTAIEGVYSNSGEAVHVASISFTGVRSEVLLHALEDKGIYVSAGSACSSNKPQVSGVLKAIGLQNDRLESTLRFSFSEENTIAQADYAIETIKNILPVLRRYVRKK